MHSETATFVSKQNVSRLVTENFEALPFSALKLLSIERLNGFLEMKPSGCLVVFRFTLDLLKSIGRRNGPF